MTENAEVVDRTGMVWRVVPNEALRSLLDTHHYLGFRGGSLAIAGFDEHGEIVAGQVWRKPTSRMLPNDGTWLELIRWCLTPEAGPNAGSRSHWASVRLIRQTMPQVTTLVSYSDPDAGHRGELYRACNWLWAPTAIRLKPPPTGNGSWNHQPPFSSPKDRWVFFVAKRDPNRDRCLTVGSAPRSLEFWAERATEIEIRLAKASPSPNLAAFARERWKD